jgi:aspartate aminotransferase-like enzyme
MNELFQYKIASEQWEFEQIKRLNYETFVEEIPQHSRSTERSLTDKFHNENVYFICVSQNSLIGMLAIRNKRPFSLDRKLDNLDSFLPKAKSICEVRILSVKKQFRHSRISYNLLINTARYCEEQGYDLAVISAILNQQKLYEHMGFVPFGRIVGTPQASFQPMYLTLRDYQKNIKPLIEAEQNRSGDEINFLPGPVEISSDVKNAFNSMSISHRSEKYLRIHKETQNLLCKLVNSKYVEILMGSGTLANDVIAGQLSLIVGKGLILSNGEFGERLIEQARCFNLNFETVSLEWGQRFDYENMNNILQKDSNIKWLWMVQCETSTGMLNDLTMLKKICRNHKILLCLDCVSSIGTAFVDLQDVYLASGVSGKGLGSFSGLAMVFYNHQPPASYGGLPAYLDLALYAEKNGVPFTISSNLVYALHTALKDFDLKKRLEYVSEVSSWLKNELRKIGAYIIIQDQFASLFVITIRLPDNLNSEKVGNQLGAKGFFVSYRSFYLLKRNWIQICLMGKFSHQDLQSLLKVVRDVFSPRPDIVDFMAVTPLPPKLAGTTKNPGI